MGDQLGFAFGDGARFVERDGFDVARVFQMNATFDQNTALGRSR